MSKRTCGWKKIKAERESWMDRSWIPRKYVRKNTAQALESGKSGSTRDQTVDVRK